MAEIHPLIRIVSLLFFSAGISLARPALLVAGFLLLAVTYTCNGFPAMGRLLQMLRRLRWLMLAILLVYGWWTPGEALLAAYPRFSPSIEGLQLGLARMAVLGMIVAAVHLLLQKTGREELLAALMQLLTPVTSRIIRERIAVRVILTMEAVSRIQPLLQEALSRISRGAKRTADLGRVASGVYASVIDTADSMPCEAINVPQAVRPAAVQWLIPLLLVAGIFLLI